MADNRMYLVHRPTGRYVGLAKRYSSGWYCGNPAAYGEALAKFFVDIEEAGEGVGYGHAEGDDFVLGMEMAQKEHPWVLDMNWDASGRLIVPASPPFNVRQPWPGIDRPIE